MLSCSYPLALGKSTTINRDMQKAHWNPAFNYFLSIHTHTYMEMKLLNNLTVLFVIFEDISYSFPQQMHHLKCHKLFTHVQFLQILTNPHFIHFYITYSNEYKTYHWTFDMIFPDHYWFILYIFSWRNAYSSPLSSPELFDICCRIVGIINIEWISIQYQIYDT